MVRFWVRAVLGSLWAVAVLAAREGENEEHPSVGMPLTEGLAIVHQSLVGVGLRDRATIGASGKTRPASTW